MTNFIMKSKDSFAKLVANNHRVLIVTRGGRPGCGFYQLGMHLNNILCKDKSGDIAYEHFFVESARDIRSQLQKHTYSALVVNGNDTTIPFARRNRVGSLNIPLIKFGGDTTQRLGNDFSRRQYDYWLIEDDNYVIYNPYVYKVGRSLQPYDTDNLGDVKIQYDVASFGLALPGKGFEKVLEYAQQLGLKRVLMHLPKSDYMDPDGEIQRDIFSNLRKIAGKLSLELTITSELLTKEALVKHLKSARELFFLYEDDRGRGSQLSGVLEYAFATGRPVYISGSGMFRHVLYFLPKQLRIEYRLMESYEMPKDGAVNYEVILNEWTAENFRWKFNYSIDKILRHYSEGGQYSALKSWKKEIIVLTRKLLERANLYKSPLQQYYFDLSKFDESFRNERFASTNLYSRCLSAKDVLEFKEEIDFFKRICPDLIPKKNYPALSQYALLLRYLFSIKVNLPNLNILAIGAYEDLLALTLKRLGIYVEEVDPNLNYFLEDFINKPSEKGRKYDIIFSMSVIEHVEDDIKFLKICEDKLKVGGRQFHTFDFLSHPTHLPETHYRMYSDDNIRAIKSALSRSKIFGIEDYFSPVYDFNYNNLDYCFASIFLERTVE